MKRSEARVRDSGTPGTHNACITGVPEEEREQGAQNIFEDITTEDLFNLGKETDIKVQEAQRVPNRINPKRTTPRLTATEVPKNKNRILKAAREKQQTTYKGTPVRLSAVF